MANSETSNYKLDLPSELKQRNIHPKFHVSRLRLHYPNDDKIFPHRETLTAYDFAVDDKTEWLVDEISNHRWKGDVIEFEVQWDLGDTTWEPLNHVNKLMALDEYLALHGVKSVKQLPKCYPKDNPTKPSRCSLRNQQQPQKSK